jgi:hypothetical protein
VADGFGRTVEDGVLDFFELRPLSMMAVAKDADFFRANLLITSPLVASEFACPTWASAIPPFPVDVDADTDADAKSDPLGLSRAFFVAALPRISPTSSAAGFFLDLSSSEDRLEDMIVSSVP